MAMDGWATHNLMECGHFQSITTSKLQHSHAAQLSRIPPDEEHLGLISTTACGTGQCSLLP